MKRLLVAIALSLCAASAWATAPAISTSTFVGHLLYGTTVTLVTTNMNTRNATFPKPIIYNDGENLTINPNAVYSTSVTWSDTDTMEWKSSTNCYAGNGCVGSTANWEDQTNVGDLTLGIRHAELPAGTTFHAQWVWKGDIMETAAKNFKMYRHWPRDWATSIRRYRNAWWGLDVTSNQPLMFNENNTTCTYQTSGLDRLYMASAGNRTPFPSSTTWHAVDTYWKSSSGPFAVDGGFWLYVDGVLFASDSSMRDKYNMAGGACTDQTDEPSYFYFQAQFSPGFPVLSPPQDKFIYWDNEVLDVSNVHVEISTSATAAAGGIRLYAPPVNGGSWSATNVQFAIPEGGYTNGQQLYVYVFNAAREVNATGYPLTYNALPPGPEIPAAADAAPQFFCPCR